MPALIYIAINGGDVDALNGWAIPTATDIAFALAIAVVVGAPKPVLVFLMAIAVIDDLMAVMIIYFLAMQ